MKTTYLISSITVCASFCLQSSALAGDFRMPQFVTTELANGVKVYLMEKHDTPLLTIRAVNKGGAKTDADKGGIANLTGDSLLTGTSSYSKNAFDQVFDFRGARINSETSADSSSLVADFASADLDTILPLFAEALQKPSFDEAEFKKLQAQTLDDIKRAKESPRQVIGNYYKSLLFGNAPYANHVEGNTTSVQALKIADIKQYYQSYYRPDNTALIVVGDFKSSDMKTKLQNLFGSWTANGHAPRLPAGGKVMTEKARVLVVNKADAGETTFMFGGPGIARNDPAYVQLQVLNTVLGGRFTSWLNDELRVNSGLTYGANSSFLPYADSGSFMVSSFTATAKTEAALALARKTYQRLWDKGIDSATLESAKAYVKGQFPPRFETNQQLAGLLADIYVTGMSRAQIDNFSKDVDSLTPEKAQALIKTYFPKENLQMVLVGKAEAIKDIAAKYGEVSQVEIQDNGMSSTAK